MWGSRKREELCIVRRWEDTLSTPNVIASASLGGREMLIRDWLCDLQRLLLLKERLSCWWQWRISFWKNGGDWGGPPTAHFTTIYRAMDRLGASPSDILSLRCTSFFSPPLAPSSAQPVCRTSFFTFQIAPGFLETRRGCSRGCRNGCVDACDNPDLIPVFLRCPSNTKRFSTSPWINVGCRNYTFFYDVVFSSA